MQQIESSARFAYGSRLCENSLIALQSKDTMGTAKLEVVAYNLKRAMKITEADHCSSKKWVQQPLRVAMTVMRLNLWRDYRVITQSGSEAAH